MFCHVNIVINEKRSTPFFLKLTSAELKKTKKQLFQIDGIKTILMSNYF